MTTRECPACAMETDADGETCDVCGYEFPVARAGVPASAWLMAALLLLGVVPLLGWLLTLLR
jgi:hypothetical protein